MLEARPGRKRTSDYVNCHKSGDRNCNRFRVRQSLLHTEKWECELQMLGGRVDNGLWEQSTGVILGFLHSEVPPAEMVQLLVGKIPARAEWRAFWGRFHCGWGFQLFGAES